MGRARSLCGARRSSRLGLFARQLHTDPPFPIGVQVSDCVSGMAGKDTEHWQAGNAAVGSDTIRRDGFSCWQTRAGGGTVTTTRPMQLNWAARPSLNVDATGGEVRVEILKEDGTPLQGCTADQCTPITGDHIRAMVRWPAITTASCATQAKFVFVPISETLAFTLPS